jgi:hypothetical protein
VRRGVTRWSFRDDHAMNGRRHASLHPWVGGGDDPRGWPAARCEGGENESGGEEPDTRMEGAHELPYHGLSFARTPLAPVSVTEQVC